MYSWVLCLLSVCACCFPVCCCILYAPVGVNQKMNFDFDFDESLFSTAFKRQKIHLILMVQLHNK